MNETSRKHASAITITDNQGRKLYWPEEDMSRLAPAAVCGVLQRMEELRSLLRRAEAEGVIMSPMLKKDLSHIARPLPYEAEWKSQNIERVHAALIELGTQCQSTPT